LAVLVVLKYYTENLQEW